MDRRYQTYDDYFRQPNAGGAPGQPGGGAPYDMDQVTQLAARALQTVKASMGLGAQADMGEHQQMGHGMGGNTQMGYGMGEGNPQFGYGMGNQINLEEGYSGAPRMGTGMEGYNTGVGSTQGVGSASRMDSYQPAQEKYFPGSAQGRAGLQNHPGDQYYHGMKDYEGSGQSWQARPMPGGRGNGGDQRGAARGPTQQHPSSVGRPGRGQARDQPLIKGPGYSSGRDQHAARGPAGIQKPNQTPSRPNQPTSRPNQSSEKMQTKEEPQSLNRGPSQSQNKDSSDKKKTDVKQPLLPSPTSTSKPANEPTKSHSQSTGLKDQPQTSGSTQLQSKDQTPVPGQVNAPKGKASTDPSPSQSTGPKGQSQTSGSAQLPSKEQSQPKTSSPSQSPKMASGQLPNANQQQPKAASNERPQEAGKQAQSPSRGILKKEPGSQAKDSGKPSSETPVSGTSSNNTSSTAASTMGQQPNKGPQQLQSKTADSKTPQSSSAPSTKQQGLSLQNPKPQSSGSGPSQQQGKETGASKPPQQPGQVASGGSERLPDISARTNTNNNAGQKTET
ncbi:hypothetical protein BaRGS_00009316, partial [Batillaria attramentaria]